ncbi:pyroglutamyl-peptidase I [Undibacterium sp. TJN19]|uniref:pyroglutamyl-peptidase I n=1 Tax=Undibacterium sp. TJN19 TaxID=3413055 RepID=UPI003BEF73F5
MKRILLTGFDPFGGELSNPSWEVARGLDARLVDDDHQIVVAQLPCEFASSLQILEAALRQYQPSIVLCLGQAGGRVDISVERIAININDARIPDNAGALPVDVPVVAGGPAAYFSSLPVKAIMHALRQAGIPASISQTAGTYVCNHVFYGLMHMAQKMDHIRQAGFIHIPYLPAQAMASPGAASMSLEVMKSGILTALEACILNTQDLRLGGGANH